MAKKTKKAAQTAEPVTATQTTETAVAPATAEQKETTMETQTAQTTPANGNGSGNFTLVRGSLSKNGKKVTFSNPALTRGLTFPLSAFVGNAAPESLTLSGAGFKTRSAEEQAKTEARNAKRVAKGQKPVLTPAERLERLQKSAAKRQAQLERATKSAMKLAARLGVAMPGAEAPAAAAAPASAPAADAGTAMQ
jgi:hypothetical protein